MGKFNCGNCCPDECCPAEGITPPTVTISGYTGGGWSGSGCCYRQVFTRIDTSKTVCCSGTLLDKSWTQQCVRKAYAVKTRKPTYFTSAPPCPLPDEYCCIPNPPLVEIGQRVIDYFERQRLALRTEFDAPYIEVTYGIGEFACDGVSGCKYFLAINVFVGYSSQYRAVNEWTMTTTTSSLHSCYTADTSGDSTMTTTGYPKSSDCNTWEPCGGATTGTFSFGRIRVFDVAPTTGSYTFTNTDILTGCTEQPACVPALNDDASISISAPGSFTGNPCWAPYTIEDNPNTLDFSSSPCVAGYGATYYADCTEGSIGVTSCSTPVTCPANLVDLPCERIVFDYGGVNPCFPEIIGQNREGLPALFYICGMDPSSSPSICEFWSVVNPFTFTGCSTSSCNATCCWYFDCDGNFKQCTPKFSQLTIGSQEITVSTYCSSYNPGAECVYNSFDVTLSIA